MFTVGIDVKKTEKELIIKWQLAKFNIALEDIIEITEDDTYGGKAVDAIRIGPPYGTTDRIFIKTKKQNYILFTTNRATIINRINS
ncbi:hypothetical protein C1N83_20490 [Priestia aryabhattai]|uniref:SunI/YnzG family protein n=1 Tax=Priestia TaxID=2800373 RepID=UPI0007ABD046|nr:MULTISPECIES: hypothetical protein [Priestia]KZE15717.1 hypothetical protein AVW12_01585 [Priestia aryabhattai]MBY0007759.1 hypothetical protein [Priestia aryabhattai]MBY0048951.1 hypothetical protein [Priestia aryabhattai]MED4392363.1 hypothetical protein [Priestia aryabhattai]WDC90120.1 hypothetical protein PSR56_08800 [Priestia megaterium]